MAESRRKGAERVTNPLVKRMITEGLAGTGESQYEFANELGPRGRRAPGQGTQFGKPGRSNPATQRGDYGG